MRARCWRKKVVDHEGFRSNYFSANFAHLKCIDERTLANLWKEYDRDTDGYLLSHEIDRFVHDCADMLINIMRPIFARHFIENAKRDASVDLCNIQFDVKYGVTDQTGSEAIRIAVRRRLMSAIRPRDVKCIRKSELTKRWPAFADFLVQVQGGQLNLVEMDAAGPELVG